ncbi:hypothetical protein EC973_001010 [Apophysomyces ossiformis]|uniref:Uncharacterized protein n=1 Tax=Apophysomyces ossiformis TaxID=679940 RepID=A0A8H7BUV4_9FUNG|nr:hypothetical protein EC973_001010 [Apophysomyces ossiformis]
MDELSRSYNRMNLHEILKEERPISPRDCLIELIHQVEESNLRQAMTIEMKRVIADHERLVTMLQQRSETIEQENEQLKSSMSEHQRRYEKAVREMQFFKKKYDRAMEGKQQQEYPDLSKPNTPNTATTPPASYLPPDGNPQIAAIPMVENGYSYETYEFVKQKSLPPPSRSSYWSTSAQHHSNHHQRQSSGAHSVYSVSTADTQSVCSQRLMESGFEKKSWHFLRRDPSMASSYSTPSTTSTPSMISSGSSVHSVPMTPVRSTTATNGYTGSSLIQQRRTDPLIFGGSDGLWETISKSKGSDVTVEKIISNFLRRGGSPNTAKQSSSAQAVKYGYGMIHALIVTKAPGSLDLLLQQGANPNAMTLSQVEEDKVSPCYLAASVGWLPGLTKLVQAGGDLVSARGEGSKNKTCLHVAAEHCHAAVVEYIVGVTQGAINLALDSQGATVLHYACASGHTDLVSFLVRSCQIPVNQSDSRQEMPLHWAARHGRLEVVTLLVERFGCDVNSYVPRKVGTPLDFAKAGSHKRLVDYLKGVGALSAKKMDKRREEDLAKQVPGHLESTLSKNGFFFDDF